MSVLPTGTVTFLLTDIEGSTALWERDPAGMERSLARHDEIMASTISSHGGVVIKHRGEGDSVFAVFDRPSAAIAAALDVQRALAREDWSMEGDLLVRVAVHTGEARLRDGDYFGRTVNRSARLRAAAHGGQIVVSSTTARLVGDQLPEGATFCDLGQHRLRDLVEPEHIFQLEHPDLASEFPPLQTLDARRHNLPLQNFPLIGRERQVAEITRQLRDPDVRLLTLTGPGGIGKTRLSVHAAAGLGDHFLDGICFVPLEGVDDPDRVVSSIAQAVGVREASGRDVLDVLAEHLGGKQILLVLDNFEQVLPAAPHIASLIAACPSITFLVTSRSMLQISGERVYPVPALAVPDEGTRAVDDLLKYDSVSLFVERARAVRTDFTLTPEYAAAVATICRRLDGLPLAIELAAARVRLLPPQAMVRRLESALPLLTGGSRDMPARQRTLRDAIAWSYDLLSETEQALFRRLSVFAGGFTLESGAHVIEIQEAAMSDMEIDLLDDVAVLLDASLIDRQEMPDGEPRFRLLRVIREYGIEQLAASSEIDAVSQRHAEYVRDLVESAEPKLQGSEQKSWIDRLQTEYDNIVSALAHCRSAGDTELFQRIAGAMPWYWFASGRWSDGVRWLEESLDLGSERTRWRAHACYGAGALRRALGDHARGRTWLNESIEIYRELGRHSDTARALHMLGLLSLAEGKTAAAREAFDEGLTIARDQRDMLAVAFILREVGGLAWQSGDIDRARAHLEESVQILRRHGDRWALAHSLNGLGDFWRARDLHREAERAYDESLAMFQALGSKDGPPGTLHNLGYVTLHQGDADKSRALFRESLAGFVELGDQRGIAECLLGLAGVHVARSEFDRAAWLFGVAHALLESNRAKVSSSNVAAVQRNRDATRQALGADAYAAAFDAGEQASVDEAIAVAMGTDGSDIRDGI